MPEDKLTPEDIEGAVEEGIGAAQEGAASALDDAGNAPDVLSQLADVLSDQPSEPGAPEPGSSPAAQPFSDPNTQVEPFSDFVKEDPAAEATAVEPSASTVPEAFVGTVEAAGQEATQQVTDASQQAAPEQASQPVQQPFDPAQQAAYQQQAQQAYQQQSYDPNQQAYQQQAAYQQPYDPNQQPYQQRAYDPNQQAAYDQAYQQAAYQQQYVQATTPQYTNGSNPGTTPLVLGILSIVFAGLIGLVLSIIGINTSGKALAADPLNGRAKAGRITSIIGLVLSILAAIFSIFLFFGLMSVATEMADDPDALISQMEELAQYDDTGQLQESLDELREELGVSGGSAGSGSGGSGSAGNGGSGAFAITLDGPPLLLELP